MEYDVSGQGPALLMIGGLGFGRWGWFKQVPDLSRRFRTVTYDVLDGRSLSYSVEDMAAEAEVLLDHLGVDKAHVLGTSLGGFVAQKLALRRPDLVDRLILICTSYGGRGEKRMTSGTVRRMFGFGSFSPENATRKGLREATSYTYRRTHPEEFESLVRLRLANSPTLSEYYHQAAAGARFDASREVGGIEAPTLVVHGAEDRYVPLPNAVALAHAIPAARLRVFRGAGHLVFIERAESVNTEISDFLDY